MLHSIAPLLITLGLLIAGGWLAGRLMRDDHVHGSGQPISIHIGAADLSQRKLARVLKVHAPDTHFEVDRQSGGPQSKPERNGIRLITTLIDSNPARLNVALKQDGTFAWLPTFSALTTIEVNSLPTATDWQNIALLIAGRANVPTRRSGEFKKTPTRVDDYFATWATFHHARDRGDPAQLTATLARFRELIEHWPDGNRAERAGIYANIASLCLQMNEPPERAVPRILEGIDAAQCAQSLAAGEDQSSMQIPLTLLRARLHRKLATLTGDSKELQTARSCLESVRLSDPEPEGGHMDQADPMRADIMYELGRIAYAGKMLTQDERNP